MVFPQIIVFSNFLDKEISTAKNIKNRLNRHNVVNTLTKIREFIKSIKYPKGVFIFAGVDEYDEYIFKFLEPEIELNTFMYDCSNKFDIYNIDKYMKKHDGSIIFVNGNECLIYLWTNGNFHKMRHIDANLVKRHKKGGQSQLRFSRHAEESRAYYVSHVIDQINVIKTKNNFIFGSDEIRKMIIERKKDIFVCINDGGFYDFNNTSICDKNYWLKYIDVQENYEKYYEKIVSLLDIDPDGLDFDVENRENMEYYIYMHNKTKSQKQIPLELNSSYYEKLAPFQYIGVKYFRYTDYYTDDTNNDDINDINDIIDTDDMEKVNNINNIDNINDIF